MKKKNQVKNLNHLKKYLIKQILIILVVFIPVSLFYKKLDFIYSSLLGAFFGLLIIDNLVKTQAIIINHQKLGAFFPRYVVRLVLYAAPIVTAIKLNQFNLWVTLFFLVSFQVLLVINTAIRAIRKVFHAYL